MVGLNPPICSKAAGMGRRELGRKGIRGRKGTKERKEQTDLWLFQPL